MPAAWFVCVTSWAWRLHIPADSPDRTYSYALHVVAYRHSSSQAFWLPAIDVVRQGSLDPLHSVPASFSTPSVAGSSMRHAPISALVGSAPNHSVGAIGGDGDGGGGDGGVPTTLPSSQTPGPLRPGIQYPVRGQSLTSITHYLDTLR